MHLKDKAAIVTRWGNAIVQDIATQVAGTEPFAASPVPLRQRASARRAEGRVQ